MTRLVDGNKIAEKIFQNLAGQMEKMSDLSYHPRLIVFLVGKNPTSLSYVKQKQQKARKIGLLMEVKEYAATVLEEELIQQIVLSSNSSEVCGILIQLPLPENMDRDRILNAVRDDLDVDCLNENHRIKLARGEATLFSPPAPAAIMAIFQEHKIDLKAKNILIVGSGDLVGKPLAAMLLNRGVSFKLANKHTKNLPVLLSQADIIVSATGVPGLIAPANVKAGAVVIDAGTAISENKDIVGDIDAKSLMGKVDLIAPVPGGVGPVTVAILLQNAVKSTLVRAQRLTESGKIV